MPDDLDVLSTVDAEFPVTDEFVSRVRRGMRRRRAARAAYAAGAAATVIAVLALVIPQLREPAPPAPPAAPAAPLLDGFRIGYIPAGLHASDRDDSSTRYVGENFLRELGSMAPYLGEPTATVSTRYYLRDDGGKWLWITVLRPLEPSNRADRATTTRWLAGSQTAGAEITESFTVPAGAAVLTTMAGTEVTTHDIVITTPDGVVLTVGANGGLPIEELRAVANGLS
ncbi:hypothetical protein JIG36_07660 [Actinoplanes sp. LDG1-06]|uniref:DUF4245 domain-containing protein n=1 Tax=Paractinoplanes ovalisporus TaxID=2810368 RepID=A0ABS2A6S3_9ACTN|nr:hypothetical protein [Actinoplanes ovalisporus]MBM2615440.1 hypothetical protein [Actinoplanes ovalisporus]